MLYSEMMKRFSAWLGLKKKLHENLHRAPLVSEGAIWWASIGENIGSEINGKHLLFSRSVSIFKKLAHEFYFVIPTTTKIKTGSWYVFFRQKEKETVACLHQAWPIDYRRLSSKLGSMDDEDFKQVKAKFLTLYQ